MVVKGGRKNSWRIIYMSIILLFIGIMYNGQSAEANAKIPYYIKVNKQQNTVTIYEKDEKGKYTVPIKAMTCTVGYATPLGIYKTPIKYRWKLLNNNVWGQYSTRIVGGILFHSVYYYQKDPSTLSWNQYNKLGTTASQGCVRLTVEDAKWIYDNCPIGTTVEIYESKDPGPLGKPETIKLKSNTGWDPTDPSLDNPFLNITPKITGVNDKVIEMGAKLNPLVGIKASSTTGFDITKKIKVTGEVDTKKEGTYELLYEVSDEIGRSYTVTSKVEVVKSTIAPTFMGVNTRYINSTSIMNRELALESVKAYHGANVIDNEDILVEINELEEGIYKVRYEVKAPNGFVTSETVHFYRDNVPPSMEGMKYISLSFNEWLNYDKKELESLVRKQIKVRDNYTDEKNIKLDINIKEKDNYTYSANYTAVDLAGNKTEAYLELTYFNNTVIHGVESKYNLPLGTDITKEYVMDKVYAQDSYGNDCTEKIKVNISKFKTNMYKVTYRIINETDEEICLDAYYTVK